MIRFITSNSIWIRGENLENPWNKISLSDYESHMSLDSVMQLQTLDSIMKEQFGLYDVSSVMILGAAGGNGFDNIDRSKYRKVYAVDINSEYLEEIKKRYSGLGDTLECICTDLTVGYKELPNADLVIADLIIEYIGYECFCKVVKQVECRYVSCAIQVNTDESFVSDSPYLHSFDCLSSVHNNITNCELIKYMEEMGYGRMCEKEYPLPNGKKLIKTDFKRI